jgi:DNA-binding NarL/FixJ family response regulator
VPNFLAENPPHQGSESSAIFTTYEKRICEHMPVRILIVDDHEIVREGIRTLIGRSRPEWEICGEATDGEQGVERCQTLKPDIVILDITMPKVSGLQAASQIAALGLPSRVLMFTMHDSQRLSGEVQHAGAQGFVLKSQAARDLIRAIDSLLAGGTFFGSEPASSKELPPRSLPDSTAESSITVLATKVSRRRPRVVRRRRMEYSWAAGPRRHRKLPCSPGSYVSERRGIRRSAAFALRK